MITLDQAEQFLFERVAPNAQNIDLNLHDLRAALDEMASQGLLGLRVPKAYGGAEFADNDFRRFQETCARCSGSLAFLQTQHQSGCSFVAQSSNDALKERFLSKLAQGTDRLGIAFSQLRRKGEPMLKALQTDEGYLLTGTAPWVTGWGIFDWCVTAAALPNGESAWLMHPLQPAQGLQASEPMRLASMELVQTVSIAFENYPISKDYLLYHRPPGWIHDSDQLNIALQSPFALGCARAALDLIEKISTQKQVPEIHQALKTLTDEYLKCREEAFSAMDDRQNSERALRSRAWAISLMGRCAHAAVVCSSGAGNSLAHPAQRIYREAIVFSVSAQTEPILSATLRAITKN